MLSHLVSLQASVHFNLFTIHVHDGNAHNLVQEQLRSSNTASGAGAPVIHLMQSFPSLSVDHPWSSGSGIVGKFSRHLFQIAV